MTLNKCTKSDIQKSLNLPANPTASTIDFLFAFDPKKEMPAEWFENYFQLLTCIPQKNKAHIIAKYLSHLLEKGHQKFVDQFATRLNESKQIHKDRDLQKLSHLLTLHLETEDSADEPLLRAHFLERFGMGKRYPVENSVRFFHPDGSVAFDYKLTGRISYTYTTEKNKETRTAGWYIYNKESAKTDKIESILDSDTEDLSLFIIPEPGQDPTPFINHEIGMLWETYEGDVQKYLDVTNPLDLVKIYNNDLDQLFHDFRLNPEQSSTFKQQIQWRIEHGFKPSD